jgi:thioredoxin reductase (NADPH)
LKGLGNDVTVMVRSILLRGFDQHIAELIGKDMEKMGVKFIRPANPKKIELNEEGKRVVTYEVDGK